MSAGRGTLIAFATGPGRVASDNPQGGNGLFTAFLIEKLRQPGLSLDQIFSQVARLVDDASGGLQTPWVVKSLMEDFYFRPSTNGSAGGAIERAFWFSVKDSRDSEELRAYLRAYPSGDFVELARIRLRDFPGLGSSGAAAEPACGSANECSRLGYEHQTRSGDEGSRLAAGYYQRGCELGDARACTNLGVMFENGQAVYEDHVKAAELYVKGCEGLDSLGCTYLGLMHERGHGVLRSPVKAYELLRQGCEGGHPIGCTHLGILYEKGEGVDRDFGRAGRSYSQGCRGHHGPGCRRLGLMYENGVGGVRNAELAAELYRLACDNRDGPACSLLGLLYSQGRGVPPDPRMAASLYRRGCGYGDRMACQNFRSICRQTRYPSCSANAVPGR